MTPLYEQHGANVVFWTLFGFFAVGEYAMRIRSRRKQSGTRSESWSLWIVVATAGVAMLLAFSVADSSVGATRSGRWPFFILGLLLMATGVFVRQWAILTLGRFFTPDVRVHSDQTVVERGPYRWVRHPSYSGLLIFFLGVGLALSNWLSLIVLVVVPAIGILVRIQSEERALFVALGDDYRRYAATRRRLFPGVW